MSAGESGCRWSSTGRLHPSRRGVCRDRGRCADLPASAVFRPPDRPRVSRWVPDAVAVHSLLRGSSQDVRLAPPGVLRGDPTGRGVYAVRPGGAVGTVDRHAWRLLPSGGRRLRPEPRERGAVARSAESPRNPPAAVRDGGRPRPLAVTGVLDDALSRRAASGPRGARRRGFAATVPARRSSTARATCRPVTDSPSPTRRCGPGLTTGGAVRGHARVPAPLARGPVAPSGCCGFSTRAGRGGSSLVSARRSIGVELPPVDPAGRGPRRPRPVPRSRRRRTGSARRGRRGRRPRQVPRGRRPGPRPRVRMPSPQRVLAAGEREVGLRATAVWVSFGGRPTRSRATSSGSARGGGTRCSAPTRAASGRP